MAKMFECSTSSPIVKTTAGRLRGFMYDGTYIFRGIKYCDAERFQAPIPVAPWDGVRDAVDYGFIAPLIDPPSPFGDIMIPHRFWPENEHCQYLNIWSRGLDDAKRPVMVWLHGGGYSSGSSLEMIAYDGDNLAKFGDVVVVTLNHRLNMLGYFDMSHFGEKYNNSVNAGNADIVAALEWVRDNIEAFGGDPDNVTIFGQSGGGMKVVNLMQTPAAYGLFHKAISMSGAGMGSMMSAPRNDKAVAEAMLGTIGSDNPDTLAEISVQELFMAYNKVKDELRAQGIFVSWSPSKNDWYLGEPGNVGFTDFAKTIPTMAGTVIGEFSFAPGTPNKHGLDAAARRELVAAKFGDHTDKLIELFNKAYPGKNEVDLLSLDSMFRPGTLGYLTEKAKVTNAPVYSYMFALEFDYDDGKPAWHCSDIPFVFHNTDKVPVCSIDGVTERLEEQVAGAYVSFAKTGNPNCDALPEWPQFTQDSKATMVFDRECEVRIDYEAELLELLAKAAPPFSFGPPPAK